MGRKHCGKRRKCSLGAISPFPGVFSKDLYCRHEKTRAYLGNSSEDNIKVLDFAENFHKMKKLLTLYKYHGKRINASYPKFK